MTESASMIRMAVPEDRASLRELWYQVFKDSYPLLDTFLRDLPQTGFAAVAETGGRPVSMAFILFGVSYRELSGAYLYAVATLPAYRGRGLSRSVQSFCRAEAQHRGVSFLSTSPSEPSLYPWYRRTLNLLPACTFSTKAWPVPAGAASGFPRGLCSATAYGEKREELLAEMPHVSFSIPYLSVQQHLCESLGGGFYRFDSCAFAGYPEEGTFHVFEFLGDPCAGKDFINAQARRNDCAAVQVRFPGPDRSCICTCPSEIPPKGSWWGLLLD